MNREHASLIIAIWTLVLAPAGCLFGALEHACPCDPVSECGHEVECKSDPCNLLLIPTAGKPLDPLAGNAMDHLACAPLEIRGQETRTGLQLIEVNSFPGTSSAPLPSVALPLLC